MPTYLKTKQASEWLWERRISIAPATLRQWRWAGRGPRFTKLHKGGPAYYLQSDLETWIASRSFANTSEVTAAQAAS